MRNDGTIHTVGAAFGLLICDSIMFPHDGLGSGMLNPKIAERALRAR